MLPVFGRGHVRDSAEVGGESVRPLEPAYVGDLLDRTICSLKKHLRFCDPKAEEIVIWRLPNDFLKCRYEVSFRQMAHIGQLFQCYRLSVVLVDISGHLKDPLLVQRWVPCVGSFF